MARTASPPVAPALRSAAHPLTGGAHDYDPLLELIGDARIVLLGEASHGTHELGSFEALFHEVTVPDFLLPIRDDPTLWT
jgi:erythromycin esterase-like protein